MMRAAMRHGRTIRRIWAACLVLAALNHALILIRHGLFWDYGGVGPGSAAYWSSLTVVDPLVAWLLLARPRVGVPATAVLIATNVAHNLAVTLRYALDDGFATRVLTSPVLLSQIGFLLFVAATYHLASRTRVFR